jgi:hypothetical protein
MDNFFFQKRYFVNFFGVFYDNEKAFSCNPRESLRAPERSQQEKEEILMRNLGIG